MTSTEPKKEFYTQEQHAAAKSADIVSYLNSIGYQLKKVGNSYHVKQHDSLVIRDDGRWFWNSKDIKGSSPIELLKQILLTDYDYGDEITAAISAVKRLAEANGVYANKSGEKGNCKNSYQNNYKNKDNKSVTSEKSTENVRDKSYVSEAPKILTLPERNKTVSRIMAYLCTTRGLDPTIISDLIKQKKLYESKDYHNAVFVAYDKENTPKYAFMRGTFSFAEKPFKQEVYLSDKSYAVTLSGNPQSDRVFCFEGAIDAISHASIYKKQGHDYQDGYRIALGGTSFLGLERFLEENPNIKNITVCLDNDSTGRKRGERLYEEFTAKGYSVDFEYSVSKDFNMDLLNESEMEIEQTVTEQTDNNFYGQESEDEYEFEH